MFTPSKPTHERIVVTLAVAPRASEPVFRVHFAAMAASINACSSNRPASSISPEDIDVAEVHTDGVPFGEKRSL